jgi:hypothetical protein
MKRKDEKERLTEPQRGERETQERERTVAPPIEREHETAEGVFEEDEERRQHERQ